MIALTRLLLSVAVLAGNASAQDSLSSLPAPLPVHVPRAPVPFGVGERAEYQVKFGFLSVGSGQMEVSGLDTVRGREVWHTIFRIRGGVPGYRVNDRLESWIDTRTLSSLRHWQELHEGSRERERRFEIFPGRTYVENERDPQPTVDLPLDDGSFLYFVRTIPLEVGQTYSFDRYFRPDRNPVQIQVLRREQIRVPAGAFETIVIRPIIKSRGVFSENGRAEVWLTDDDRRLMVQMKSRLSFGSLNLYLKSYRPATVDSSGVAMR
ncbi:MAG TPA: DUF3108 domain-containing protein [Kofleriaceae bacterium]|nr:DUF3108 domain-containing protein [Kofleriaceae bacterium]